MRFKVRIRACAAVFLGIAFPRAFQLLRVGGAEQLVAGANTLRHAEQIPLYPLHHNAAVAVYAARFQPVAVVQLPLQLHLGTAVADGEHLADPYAPVIRAGGRHNRSVVAADGITSCEPSAVEDAQQLFPVPFLRGLSCQRAVERPAVSGSHDGDIFRALEPSFHL